MFSTPITCSGILTPENCLVKTNRGEVQVDEGSGSKSRQLDDLIRLGKPVPPFARLHSGEVKKFLSSHAPEVFEDWQTLGELYDSLDSKTFLEDERVLSLLENVQKGIINAFSNAQESDLTIPLPVQKGLLIFRSSGEEDGGGETEQGYAYAGKHLSVKHVPPTHDDAKQAAGRVVASYFTREAIAGRVKRGLNPFTSPLKLEVIVQELVDAKASMVVATNVPDYGGNKQFRIMKISVALGQGEGVVGNGISTDTIYLLQSRRDPTRCYIIYKNTYKPFRLDSTLKRVPNPPEIASTRVLDHKTLEAIFAHSLEIEDYYGSPRDMELVIDQDDTLYFVQTRALNRSQTIEGSYLDLADLTVEEELIAKVLVPGKLSASVISSANDILIETSLKLVDEQEMYDRDLHKLVVVKQDEIAELTHPILNMSEVQAPVVYTSDEAKVLEMLRKQSNGTHQLAVCMQRGTLFLIANDSKVNIKQGFITHPAPLGFSLDNVPSRLPLTLIPSPPAPSISKQVRMLEEAISASAPTERAFDALKANENVTILSERIRSLEAFIAASPANETVDAILVIARKMEEAVAVAFEELGQVLKTSSEPLEMLFHVKIVSTLFHQKNSAGVNCYSVFEVLDLLSSANDILHSNLSARFALASLDGKLLAEDNRPAWNEFLQGLETIQNLEKLDRFQAMLDTLRREGFLGNWINTFFLEACTKKQPESILDALLSQWTPEAESALGEMASIRKDVHHKSAFLSELQNPLNFEKTRAHIAETLDSVMAFLPRVNSGSQLVRISAVSMLEEVIGFYDSAIKELKASPTYDRDLKSVHMKALLDDYLKLLEALPESLPLEKAALELKQVATVKQTLNSLSPSAALLSPSKGFSVDNPKMLPETLDDIFTWIHRRLLAYASAYNAEVEIRRNDAELFSQARFQASAILPKSLYQSTSYEGSVVTQRYTLPLQQHGGEFSLAYDTKTKEYTFHGSFQGGDLGAVRCKNILGAAELYDRIGLLTLRSPSVNKDNVNISFSWRINTQEDLTLALTKMQEFGEYTIEERTSWIVERLDQEITHLGKEEDVQQLAREYLGAHRHLFPALLDLFFAEKEKKGDYLELISIVSSYPETYNPKKMEQYAKALVKENDLEKIVKLEQIALGFIENNLARSAGKILMALAPLKRSHRVILEAVSLLSQQLTPPRICSELLQTLVEHGTDHLSEVVYLGAQLLQHHDSEVRGYSAPLFITMAECEVGTNEILTLIPSLYQSGESMLCIMALRVLTPLLKRGIGIDIAREAVKAFCNFDLSDTSHAEWACMHMSEWVAEGVPHPPLIDLSLALLRQGHRSPYTRGVYSSKPMISVKQTLLIFNALVVDLEDKTKLLVLDILRDCKQPILSHIKSYKSEIDLLQDYSKDLEEEKDLKEEIEEIITKLESEIEDLRSIEALEAKLNS